LVLGASLVAVVGIVQFAFGIDLSRYLRLPGLVAGTVSGDSFIDTRSVLRRVQGTTAHPIEMAVFLGMVLPLVVHYARTSVSRSWQRLGWLASAGLILASIPLTVSRSGVVALAVVALVLVPTWPWRERVTALAGAAVGLAAIRLAVPGLIGTLRSLFTYFGTDPSITHRTGDYARAVTYIVDAPWFGRGFHSFIHSYYFVTDNQYLLSLIETGIVGLAALVGLLLAGIVLAAKTRRISSDAGTRDLAQALLASLAVAGVCFATFDALYFPMVTGTTFVLLGSAGALWRIERARAEAASQ
jgi:O-antigen ligase